MMSRVKSRHYIELDKDDVEWLDKSYPRVYLSALLSMLLREFRNAHNVTPAELTVLGAKELKRLLDEEKEEG